MGRDQHTKVTQRKKMVENITADGVALALRSAGVPPTWPWSASAMYIQNKKFEENLWLFNEILEFILRMTVDLNFYLTGVQIIKSHETLAGTHEKKRLSYISLVCVGQYLTGTKNHRK